MSVERYSLTEDYSISRVINGCWQLSDGHSLGSKLDFEDVLNAFTQLVEKGFTTFDCADIYTGTEEFLGNFSSGLKTHSSLKPEDIQIHTKYVPDMGKLSNLTFEDTEAIIDRSLKRLKRDTLDMVQFHWWDYDIKGFVETAMNLDTLKKKGKIRNISVTNFDEEHLSKIVDAGVEIVSCQTQYSVIERRPEKGFIDYCTGENISQICYGTISGGLISDKFLGMSRTKANDNRSQVKYLQVIEESMGWDAFQELLTILKEIAVKHSVSISNIASRYILEKKAIAAIIIGTRSSRHIESNQRIFELKLSAGDMKKIDDFLISQPILAGEPYELERNDSKFKGIIKMNLNKKS